MTALEKDTQELKTRICTIIDTMQRLPTLEGVAHAIYQAAGYQPFLWHIDDIRCAWADRHGLDAGECPLTDEKCREILDRMHSNHDAQTGINWEVIQSYLD